MPTGPRGQHRAKWVFGIAFDIAFLIVLGWATYYFMPVQACIRDMAEVSTLEYATYICHYPPF